MPNRRDVLDACRSLVRSVQRSNRLPGSCPRNRPSNVCQAVVSLVRWRRCHWRTMNVHRLEGTLWLAASLKYYANEGCKTCASLTGLLLTYIVAVTEAVRTENGSELRRSIGRTDTGVQDATRHNRTL